MMRKIGIVGAFLSVFLFPWPIWVGLLFILSPFEPLVPLAVGLFADTLYYAPRGSFFPVFTLLGAALTMVAFFVRGRLKTSSM